MNQSFESFASAARARGFDEIIERTWQPNEVTGEHTHPFEVDAIVVRGEMWLSDAAGTKHLVVGDTFQLDANVPHRERYGADGATYWVARKS